METRMQRLSPAAFDELRTWGRAAVPQDEYLRPSPRLLRIAIALLRPRPLKRKEVLRGLPQTPPRGCAPLPPRGCAPLPPRGCAPLPLPGVGHLGLKPEAWKRRMPEV